MSETKAKRAKILDMLDGYSNLIGKELTGLTNALCREAEPFPLDVVIAATQRLGRTCKFPPTTAEVFEACEHFNTLKNPKVVTLYNGMIDMDFGHGRIDMRGLTTTEQDQIIKLGGKTRDGRNMALLSLDEKRDALKGIEPPKTKRITTPVRRA
jgi:hypothetical protein